MSETPTLRYSLFRKALDCGQLILDGGMGSSLVPAGDNPSLDFLSLTHPEMISRIHRAFLEAGADIIEANTFLASTLYIDSPDSGLTVEKLNRESIRLARTEADRFEAEGGERRFVAGCMASPPDSFPEEKISAACYEQASILIKSGADIIILETVCFLPAARAALEGINKARADYGNIPLILSGFIAEDSSHFFCGSSLKDFIALAEDMKADAAGLNCGTNPHKLAAHLEEMSLFSALPLVFYPGIDRDSSFSPEEFAKKVGQYLADGRIKIGGGCCGTKPEHISALCNFIGKRGTKRV